MTHLMLNNTRSKLLLICLLFSLSGCGGGSGSGTTANTNTAQTEPPPTESPTEPPANGPSQPQPQPPVSARATLTVSWDPPLQKMNGEALNDLAGYKILVGSQPNHYDRVFDVSNPGLASYVIEDLVAGRYYVVVRAYNTQGVLSPYSNVAVIDTM